VNYRRLEYFLAVVDAGTVTAAAEELHIAQPALSQPAPRTLEREIKMPLFETRGNRLVLTQAAHAFVQLARRLHPTDTSDGGSCHCASNRRSFHIDRGGNHGFNPRLSGPLSSPPPAGEDPLLLARETTHFGIHETLLHGADFIVSPTAHSRPDLETLDLGSIPLKAYVGAGSSVGGGSAGQKLPLEN
jgi:hypothetical protein